VLTWYSCLILIDKASVRRSRWIFFHSSMVHHHLSLIASLSYTDIPTKVGHPVAKVLYILLCCVLFYISSLTWHLHLVLGLPNDYLFNIFMFDVLKLIVLSSMHNCYSTIYLIYHLSNSDSAFKCSLDLLHCFNINCSRNVHFRNQRDHVVQAYTPRIFSDKENSLLNIIFVTEAPFSFSSVQCP
jgi:hypothetical protein